MVRRRAPESTNISYADRVVDRDLKKGLPGSQIRWYVILESYVSMAVSGLGFLALTWSTVVLLGGFVTLLRKIDFWCITVLSLIQVLRIFNSFNDGMVLYLLWVFFAPFMGCIIMMKKKKSFTGQTYWLGKAVCAPLITLILLGLLAMVILVSAVIISGIVMSILIPLVRLKKQDYTDDVQDVSKANLKPALNIFYSLSLGQGLLYWTLYALLLLQRVALNTVIRRFRFGKWGKVSVRGYLKTTRDRCCKDPNLAKGWNIIQYAVGLLESESLEDYLSSARMIDTFINQGIPVGPLIRSSRHKTLKLLSTLGLTNPDDQEVRILAARIVASFAGDLQLYELPGATKLISKLLETSMESSSKKQSIYIKDIEEDSRELITNGLQILELVAKDRHNLTEIYCTEGLLGNIIHLTCANTMIQYAEDGEWRDHLVCRSMTVIRQLVTSPGKASRDIRHTISCDEKAISNMERILVSNQFPLQACECAVDILAELALDMSTVLTQERRDHITQELLRIFLGRDMNLYLVRLAGQALVKLSLENKFNATALLSVTGCGNVVGRLTDIIDADSSAVYMKIAVEILENLLVNYEIDRAYVKDMTLPKALKALLDTIQEAIPSSSRHSNLSGPANDAENPHPPRSNQDILPPTSEQNAEQLVEQRKLVAALLSLITLICANWTSAEDFAASVEPLAPNFVRKLKQIVEANMNGTFDCLRILKAVAEIVMLMLKHCPYVEVIRSQGIIESLCAASTTISHLEDFMVSAEAYVGGERENQPVRPLFSDLVNQAQQLLNEGHNTS